MADIRNDLISATAVRNPYLVASLVNPIQVKTITGSYFPVDYDTTTVQTNRSLAAAVTAEALGDNAKTFALQEQLDRILIDDRLLGQYGGLPGAQKVAASRGQMTVFKQIESLLAVQVMDGGLTASVSTPSTNWLADLRAAAQALRDICNTRIALVTSFTNWASLVGDSGVKAAMQEQPTVIVQPNAEGIRDIRRTLMAAAIGVDEVMIGSNDAWNTAVTAKTSVAVLALPNGAMTCEEEAQPISYIQQVVENESGIINITTHKSDDLKADVVDVRSFALFDVINAELGRLVQLS
jgi:hypothetical protein